MSSSLDPLATSALKTPHWRRVATIGGTAGLMLALASPALSAQPALNIQRFQPAPWTGSWLNLWAPMATDAAGFQGSVFASYAARPLVFGSEAAGNEAAVVSDLATLELGAGWQLSPVWSVGASLPLAVVDRGTQGAAGLKPPAGAALGDMRLAAMATLAPAGRGLGLALGGELGLPSAGAGSFAGDDGLSGGLRAIVSWRGGGTSVAGNWGVWMRSPVQLGANSYGTETRLSLGVRQALGASWSVLGEATAASPLDISRIAEAGAAEMLAGATRCLDERWELFAAVGGGALSGPGAVAFRGVAGVRHGPCRVPAEFADRDRDGVADERDTCPDQAGPNGGSENPGCPDRDSDGVADRRDACPDLPGVRQSQADRHGCPPDSDGDGVADSQDACPAHPGRLSPTSAQNGCPDADGDAIADGDDACPSAAGPASSDRQRHGCPSDRDKDGVADAEDACPDIPGRASRDLAANGCPGDRDKDGVLDDDDRCPDLVGPKSDHLQLNGCPPPKVEASRIGVAQAIEFATDSAVVGEEYRPLLLQLALLLLEHPEIRKLSVDGHTDDAHTPEHNLQLSKDRAKAVHDQLVKLGVPKGRLQWRGFGMTQPVEANTSETGRRKNRRVEFVIVERR